MASRHSWSPIPVPFTLDCITLSHVTVLVPRFSQRSYRDGAPAMASYSDACAFWTLWHQISLHISRRNREWSTVLNYVLPWRATIRCPVTTHDAVQFSKVDRVGLEIDIPTWLTGRKMTPQYGTSAVDPRRRARRKELCKASPNGIKYPPTTGVTLWMKSHSCWRDFFRPA